MGMTFCSPNFSSNSGTGFSLLFASWVIKDARSYALACLGVFAMGLAHQGLLTLRATLAKSSCEMAPVRVKASLNELEQPMMQDHNRRRPLKGAFLRAALDMVLYAAGLFMAYLCMLVAMAYDFGLLAALVAGETTVYVIAKHYGLAAAAPHH
jgi:Ctr copper transporter family